MKLLNIFKKKPKSFTVIINRIEIRGGKDDLLTRIACYEYETAWEVQDTITRLNPILGFIKLNKRNHLVTRVDENSVYHELIVSHPTEKIDFQLLQA